jgi:hypothetical protein
MNSEDSTKAEHLLSTAEDSSPVAASDEGEVENRELPPGGYEGLIGQAETRADAAGARSVQAETRTVEAEARSVQKNGVNAYVKPVDFSEFMRSVARLGVFWAAVNEPPPYLGKKETLL